MKFLATAAWVVLIGITVSACASITPTFDDDNKPPYGQSSGQKSGRR
jgi:hypothetical protein